MIDKALLRKASRLHVLNVCSASVPSHKKQRGQPLERHHLVVSNTMGAQRAIDHAPDRWIVIAEVLDMVRRYVPMVQARWPEAVEVHPDMMDAFPAHASCDKTP